LGWLRDSQKQVNWEHAPTDSNHGTSLVKKRLAASGQNHMPTWTPKSGSSLSSMLADYENDDSTDEQATVEQSAEAKVVLMEKQRSVKPDQAALMAQVAVVAAKKGERARLAGERLRAKKAAAEQAASSAAGANLLPAPGPVVDEPPPLPPPAEEALAASASSGLPPLPPPAEAPPPQPSAASASSAPAGQAGKITAANLVQLDMWTKALQVLKPGALAVPEPAFQVFAKQQLEEVVKYCTVLYCTILSVVAFPFLWDRRLPIYFILVVSTAAHCCFFFLVASSLLQSISPLWHLHDGMCSSGEAVLDASGRGGQDHGLPRILAF